MIKQCYPYILEKYSEVAFAVKSDYIDSCDNCSKPIKATDVIYYNEALSEFFCLECSQNIIEFQLRFINDQKILIESLHNYQIRMKR